MASKRKAISVDEKVCVIRAIEKGEKKSDVGRRFELSQSTVATIWKNKKAILQAALEGNSSKKLRKPKFEELDQAMLSWVNNQRQNNVPISGPIVKARAEKFANQLGVIDFKASEGWLGKFKHRHQITYGKMNGEVRDVDMNVSNNWITTVWPKLKKEYSPEIVDLVAKIKETPYNQDEEDDQVDEAESPTTIQQAIDAANTDSKITKREDYIDWREYFMATAFLAAKRSKDPSYQVGACIVNKENKIVGIGYNGMPIGCSDDDFPWGKNSPSPLENKQLYVCHAEMNAILNKNSKDVKDCTIYVGLFPCNECAKLIIQSGIREVIYLSDEKAHKTIYIASKKMLDAAGVKHWQYIPKHDKIEIKFTEIDWKNMSPNK